MPYCNRKLCSNDNSSFLSLSETFRSVKNFILVFLKCSEAWKTLFWSFCSVQKREKLLFGLSDACRSMKKFFLAFLQRAEVWKINFWPFCSVQKREKSIFSLSAACRSMKKSFFVFLQRAEVWFIYFVGRPQAFSSSGLIFPCLSSSLIPLGTPSPLLLFGQWPLVRGGIS